MLFSVIVPVYNAEKTLARLMNSLNLQTLQLEYEVLLINDGSQDCSLEICENYAKSNNRIYVFTQPNKGPSAARNLGIKNAKGQFLLFLDADDYVTSNYFEKLSQAILDNNVDLYIYGVNDVNLMNGKYQSSLKHTIMSAQYSSRHQLLMSFSTLLNQNLVYSQCTKVYRSEYIKKYDILFNERLQMGEDLEFNLKVFSIVDSVVVLPLNLYNYTHEIASRGIHSITTSYCKNYYENIWQQFDSIEGLLKKESAATFENMQRISRFWGGRISSALQNVFLADVSSQEKKMEINTIIYDPKVQLLFRRAGVISNPLHRILSFLILHKWQKFIYPFYFFIKYIKKYLHRPHQKFNMQKNIEFASLNQVHEGAYGNEESANRV